MVLICLFFFFFVFFFFLLFICRIFFFFFKQKTAYEIKECDWSSDVCSSDLYGFERGDIDEAASLADIVIERDYDFPAVYQYSMETHAVIARHDGAEIRLWAN